jgi:hypothetical protein
MPTGDRLGILIAAVAMFAFAGGFAALAIWQRRRLSAGRLVLAGVSAWLLAGVGALFLGVVFNYDAIEQHEVRQAEEQRRFERLAAEFAPLADATASETDPHLTGSILLVDAGEELDADISVLSVFGSFSSHPNHVSDFQSRLSLSSLAAKTPDAVGTIVILKWNAKFVGIYSDQRTGGYRPDCDVIVIDRATRTVLATKSFEGAAPANYIPGRPAARGAAFELARREFGHIPEHEIVEYLESLPRR